MTLPKPPGPRAAARSPLDAVAPVQAALRMAAILLWTALLVPVYLVLRRSVGVGRLWHRGLLWIAGVRVTVHGTQTQNRPTVLVCNHVSYVDIPLLGGLIGAPFVAKADMIDWPGLGFIARIGNTEFVSRDPRKSRAERDRMIARLRAAGRLVLFPEGTTSDGNRVLPFKSAFLALAERELDGRPVTVQPLAITYTCVNGVALDHRTRPDIAWYGDMSLVPHLWQFLQLGRVDVALDILPPITAAEAGDRKTLARLAHAAVRDASARRRGEGSPYCAPAPTAPTVNGGLQQSSA